jgi:hypothetical protein
MSTSTLVRELASPDADDMVLARVYPDGSLIYDIDADLTRSEFADIVLDVLPERHPHLPYISFSASFSARPGDAPTSVVLSASPAGPSTSGLYTLEAHGQDTHVRPVGHTYLHFAQEAAVLREVLDAHPDLDDGVWITYDDATGQEVLVVSPREA